ncbi:uncharacterized protein A4U43_C03F19480 [Asparagus officinalis]|uniref:GPI inositol-deacylase n=1 Tax=Asparagus officinalis TaxID=4686 RepID=A0A5P1FBD7_ASPOF|nr:uncharacterized protein LOC109834043 isoform X2 [Asparagus officinalis]ONK75686.1 uncharacterized protein A4U43_C03F19480 [Asparagus officinalis]
MLQTSAAAAVLWKSLTSVMSSANQEMRSGFEFRVAALLADIAAASGSRRSAIVGAGGGAVVDWLLETVGTSGRDRSGTREEAARALAYLVADPGVCESVLGRPGAVPNLLRFIFWFQPNKETKYKHSSLDDPHFFKGRSMLVAALMDIVTSNCETTDFTSFQPLLPGNADTRDIAAALEVVEEGGMHLDDEHGEDDDGGSGMKGIGIKVLGGPTILGFSRMTDLLESDNVELESTSYTNKYTALQETSSRFLQMGKDSTTVPGLWDDLQREHIAVPFAAWALANWALASDINRSHIQELDRDGNAIMTALMAPERTVKWHGSLVARALLDDQNLPLTDSVPGWSSSLLSSAFHSSKVGDISLAQVALSAYVVSVERSDSAKKAVVGKGLYLMRQIAKQAERHRNLQDSLARVLELLYAGDMHLSLEESQRWSGILLRWVFNTASTDALRHSATKILSFILEDYGPASIPISQGWLAICLNEIIEASKTSNLKGSTALKTNKVQIDESNALSAAQTVNLLSNAVIKLASNQLESESDSVDGFPFADLLSLEPFAALFKNMKKTNVIKFDAADSALATLKSIKALSELCSEDVACQNKLADSGILCLLRRLLLNDDYENLAAIETYDASRALEMQDRGSSSSGDRSSVESNDPSSVRVPPTAHIRRHAARLLRIISLLPKVKEAILADKDWCKWLDDCASGKASCCNDLKTQSNARATLLNIFCLDQEETRKMIHRSNGDEGGNQRTKCAQYEDMIFLINPELSYWKWPGKKNLVMCQDSPVNSSPSHDNDSVADETSNTSNYLDVSDLESRSPLLDVVFIHGLRGGPFKSWRIADNKSSTTSKAGLVENIDQEAGKEGTCWPREWLSADFPYARLFTVKYKTNLTQWSGASLPLQEVSSMLLQKLVAAGIGDQPVVFITHSLGGLVVKQMLYQAKISNLSNFVNNTVGIVFYSCPHFGSKLADMPWRMGMVFRPAPTIGELRSGSPRLVELNDFVRHLHKKGHLEVLSFSETQVTPIVEAYGGWAFRMEIVPIESAYPGFGELVVLDGTDHINSCKPVNQTDPSYSETLEFLNKLRARLT